MTNRHPYEHPCSSAATRETLSTYWKPLDEQRQWWTSFAATASTSWACEAVGAAFAALGQEQMALRHVTQAKHARPSCSPRGAWLGLWSEGYQECGYALEALSRAIACWHQAAITIDQHAEYVAPTDKEAWSTARALLGDALVQRVRLACLVWEVLDTQFMQVTHQMAQEREKAQEAQL